MDDTDQRLIAALTRDGRAGLGELAAQLGISRATVRTRLARLEASGEIAGYTVLTRADLVDSPVRALMMVAIEGAGTDRAVARMLAMPAVRAVHSTTGRWDVIVALATESLATLDETLARIRRLEGVSSSETNLLMSTRRAGGS
jgi:DNA-binding Lrp family transcriptional regulator